MDLILWRNAEAEAASDKVADSKRKLSGRGSKHAAQMAEWLKKQHLREVQVLASPARRARQTAHALGLPYDVKTQLAAGADAADLLAAAGWPDHQGTVILVSHQPALGRLAALLLSGQEADWTIKRSGVWWFSNRVRRNETQTILRAVTNL
ncbi:histidine phosphatase family protein [Accumulibacter sp.]|uniref:SixA phosphatase family protein n=1 Tax=Accumulibacter sp. TaxID=2053492 RepID=UPI001D4CBD54|nr:histidine phosphatase family protein [Accumulibacter sp.]MCB1931648.1 histidine phosphatase family protein [Accumulibacter sp.]MCB1966987.1 histidine phosphatase family protein [Accumulibacter sp.]MCP5229664.1 histidine phosphatase family protein [Accumulibacter sp.]